MPDVRQTLFFRVVKATVPGVSAPPGVFFPGPYVLASVGCLCPTAVPIFLRAPAQNARKWAGHGETGPLGKMFLRTYGRSVTCTRASFASPSGGLHMTDASVLDVGTQCFYRKRDGTVATVVVLKVHHDEQPPYYTIGVDATEREKQTEREKLRPCSQGPWPEAQVTPEVTRQLSVKSVAALDKLARCSPDAHALFRQIDKNGDGAITVRELCEFFVSTDDAFARRLFKAIDTDDDGLIDIDEFRLAHKTATETRESVKTFFSPERRALEPQEIEALFAQIDLDRDGCITKRELTHYLRDTLRCPDPEGHAERLRSFIDRDDDKLIDKKSS